MEREGVILYHPSKKSILDNPGMIAPFSGPALAGVLLEDGYNVRVVDPDREEVDDKELLNTHHLFFMSVPTGLYPEAIRKRNELREEAKREGVSPPEMSVGGSHVSHFKHNPEGWDYKCVGEGWEVAGQIAGGNMEKGVIVGRVLSLEELQRLPPPAYHLLKDSMEYRRSVRHEPTLPIMTSIGCWRECAFCAPHFRQVRFFSPEQIATMLEGIKALGVIQVVDYGDDLLKPNKSDQNWLEKFIEVFKARDMKLRFSAHVKSILKQEEGSLGELVGAGAIAISIGIDGPLVEDDRWLKYFKKGITRKECLEALEKLKKAGMPHIKVYQIFPPKGGILAALAIIKLAKNPNIDSLQLSHLAILPGTDMAVHPEKYGLRKRSGIIYDASNPGSTDYSQTVYLGKGEHGGSQVYTSLDILATLYTQMWLRRWRRSKPAMPV